MYTRIPFVLLFVSSVLWGPFWSSMILLLIGVALYNYFFEGPVLKFLMDLMYGVPLERFYGYTFVAFSSALVLLFLAEYIKQKSRFKTFYEKNIS